MGLLGNYSVLNRTPGRFVTGNTIAQNRSNFNTNSSNRNPYTSESWQNISSVPNGVTPPYSWIIPQSSGGLSSINSIQCSGEISEALIAGGRNAQADIAGNGTISNASLGLILSAVATLSGSGDLSADITGKLDAIASLAGSGDITAALGALASLVSTLLGAGSIEATPYASASMGANINVTGATLTAANVAASVWNALASEFNTAGTMGNKLNAASSAGDPWSTALPGAYAAGTAGELLGSKVLTEEDLNKIADIILRRATANVEASDDGDPINIRSLYGLIAQGVHNTSANTAGTVLTVRKSDDTTTLATRTLTTNPDAQPITGIDTD